MPYPIQPVTRPSTLNGASNGQLDPAVLVAVPGGQLEKSAARAWMALVAAAAADGIELKPTSSADTYRTLKQQTTAFLSRYTPTYDPRVNSLTESRTYEGKRWWKRKGVAALATPGTSNHGWGLAVDVANSSGSRLNWLLANAAVFGFSWESQSEAWHIRYVAGDKVPAAVAAHDGSAPAVRPTLRKGDKGTDVAYAQTKLNAHRQQLVVDGEFGRKTDAATRAFQTSHGLICDGIIGPQTWAALERTGCC